MIPLSLKLEAFLPFKEPLSIDFSAVREDKMFLITGNTGSGKTALFDAVCFALYGEPSGAQRSSDSLKCQLAGEDVLCYVEFEFLSRGERFAVKRTPLQNRRRRNGSISPEPASAVLTLPDGTALTKIGEVNRKIEEILGLNCEQFKKIVMLPQGEFRRFLSDSSAGKQEILRRIFSTRLFDDFTEALKQEARKSQEALAALTAGREALLLQITPLSDEELSAAAVQEYPDYGKISLLLSSWLDRFEAQTAAQKQENQILSQKLHALNPEEAKALNLRLDSLKQAKEQKAALLAEEAQIQKDKILLSQLVSCGELCLIYDSLTLSAQRKEEAERLRLQASETLAVLSPQLEEAVKNLQKQEQINLEIPQKSELLAVKRQNFTSFETLKSLDSEILDTQNTLRSLTLLQKRHQLLLKLEETQKQTAHLKELLRLEDCYEASLKEAEQTFLSFQSRYAEFLAGQAQLLAKELKKGVPCPVCGSLEHPNPCVSGQKPVSKEELDSASDAYETARKKAEKDKLALTAACSQSGDLLPSEEEFSKISVFAVLEKLQSQSEELSAQLNSLPESGSPLSAEECENALRQTEAFLQSQTLKRQELCEKIESFGESEESMLLHINRLKAFLDDCTRLTKEASAHVETLRAQYEKLSRQESENRRLAAQYEEDETGLQNRFETLLHSQNISRETFFSLREQTEQIPVLKERISRYEKELMETEKKIEAEQAALAGKERVDLKQLLKEREEIKKLLSRGEQAFEKLLSACEGNRRVLSALEEKRKEYDRLSKEYASAAFLYETASGKNQSRISFERYVLSFYFDKVIESANLRLHAMTDGRYFLRRKESREKGNASSGLDLEIFDSYSGKFRHVNTLSGGESFKTALCLALGLADIITRSSGGVEIDTIFIDEGFGTLDQEALENAVDCLRQLKDNGRYIGIISHVPQLCQKIPLKLAVTSGVNGSKASFVQKRF